MYCLHCNKIIESQEFCPECGRLLVDESCSLENRDIEMEIEECNNLEKDAKKKQLEKGFLVGWASLGLCYFDYRYASI